MIFRLNIFISFWKIATLFGTIQNARLDQFKLDQPLCLILQLSVFKSSVYNSQRVKIRYLFFKENIYSHYIQQLEIQNIAPAHVTWTPGTSFSLSYLCSSDIIVIKIQQGRHFAQEYIGINLITSNTSSLRMTLVIHQ